MCLGVFLLGFILLGTLYFLHLVDYFLSHVRKVFTYFFKYFLVSFLSSPAGICIMRILVSLMLSQRSLRLSSFFFFFHSFFYILFCGSDSHQSILQITYLFFCISYSAIDSFQCIVHLFVLYFSRSLVIILCIFSVFVPLLFWDLGSSSLSLFWIRFLEDCLSPFHLIVFLEFYLVPLSGTKLFAFSPWLSKPHSVMWFWF